MARIAFAEPHTALDIDRYFGKILPGAVAAFHRQQIRKIRDDLHMSMRGESRIQRERGKQEKQERRILLNFINKTLEKLLSNNTKRYKRAH